MLPQAPPPSHTHTHTCTLVSVSHLCVARCRKACSRPWSSRLCICTVDGNTRKDMCTKLSIIKGTDWVFMFHKHAPDRLWRKHRCARKEPKLCKLRVTEKEAKGTDKDRSERSICGTTWKHDYITSCSQQTCLLKWVWLTHIQDMFSSTSFVTSTYTLQSYSAKYSHSVVIPLLAASDRKVSEGNETIYTNYTVK